MIIAIEQIKDIIAIEQMKDIDKLAGVRIYNTNSKLIKDIKNSIYR